MEIAYYPASNCIRGINCGHRFKELSNATIDEIGFNKAKEMTGLSYNQLKNLFIQLRFPYYMSADQSHRFTGEEVYLHFMVYLRTGDSKLRQVPIFRR